MTFYDKLQEVLPAGSVLKDEPMKNHTTFKVGGPADYLVLPREAAEIAKVIKLCKEAQMPYYVCGNGSNLLVGDKGYRGVIIKIGEEFSEIAITGEEIRAAAGATLTAVANRGMEACLTGFEFASGIPGTVGGACMMNAGAYGGEMKDVLQSVQVLTEAGELLDIPREKMELGYRTSVFAKKKYIVLGATILLKKGDCQAIVERMADLRTQRTTKQPLEYPSAGSTFKRPEGYFAGKLIQDSGLSGKTIGGAQVSTKHNGFVINYNEATAKDVTDLMEFVIATVREKFGVTLEPEVKRIGEF
ncbi:UDP-N-acetylmuramate dehydrogenase [Ohessyouella blattaphilus]|uniref:UDP-N-acetylenolpyruvoylglucosamine reductase n=1 Tax=Ohessyouella blattaphilus TaxID=2949333 RepID=A0ABT1EEF0_9FIRM|nr:UDP-N-acetylmuramate dehydrogenase [Ohessyouella blattaphilus]MCP1109018.1 UDP-N-acetylmuramate dehydrogenase [Ohessyouella blattaphilus]MCR8562412.1 UDP-N-acetylmuramate dehydrogenase [Ohessyouella blattaphilus]